MIMFEIGTIVRNMESGVRGEVVDVDGDTVYIELDNGCEHDYNVSVLMSEKEFLDRIKAEVEAAKEFEEAKQADGAGMFGSYKPRRGDHKLAIDCLDMIGRINKDVLLVADSLIKEAGKLDEFETAKPLNKVMMISEVLDVPTVVFMGAAESSNDDLMREVIAKTMLRNPGIFLMYKVKTQLINET